MNERFESLAEEAMVHVPGSTGLHTRAFSLEKFAELIVRECAGVTLDYKNNDHYTGWCDHAEEILRHFGVEE